MKYALVTFCVLLYSYSVGQKKLLSKVEFDFANGLSVDSSSHFYNSWEGSLFNHQHFEGYNENGYYGYFLKTSQIPCDSILKYSGTSYPLSSIINGQIVNELNGDKITSKTIFNSNYQSFTKSYFSYDNQNRVKKIIKEIHFNSSINWLDSTIFNYDPWGNLINKSTYDIYNGTQDLISTDSIEYGNNGTQILRTVRFEIVQNSGPILTKVQEILNTIVNNQIKYTDGWYLNPITSVFEWRHRYEYFYNSSGLSSWDFYFAYNNVLSTNSWYQAIVHKNNDNQLINYHLTSSADDDFTTYYYYDNDGFLIEEEQLKLVNGSYSTLLKTQYYFQSTMSTAEIYNGEISIYPNPTIDEITIKTESELMEVMLYNQKGQLLVRQKGNQLDIRHIPAGEYTVSGSTANGEFSRKIIKL